MDPFVLDSENKKDDKPLCTTCRAGVEYVAPDDFDFERYEARSKIAEKTGKALDEVTEEEIDKLIRFKRLDKI
jgi:hypothetical protein